MNMGYRLVIRKPGGPEAIEREDYAELPQPGAGEVRVRNTAVGVNFIDVYHRTGLYPLPYPAGLGREAAGVIEAVGEGVNDFAVGDRVGFLFAPYGSYATYSIVPVTSLFALSANTPDETAAATLLKGLTAWMLIEKCARVSAGDAVLVHAAAGGVGSIAVQWLKAIGAIVIAHAGSAQKAEIAKQLGADHALNCSFDSLAAEVRALTGGRGVVASLDGVGNDSWQASLDALAPRGMYISYGNASGPVPPFAPLELSKRGSLFVTRPGVADYLVDAKDRREGAARLFELLDSGAIKVSIGQRFALSEAATAHRALEARQTTGSTILLPYEG